MIKFMAFLTFSLSLLHTSLTLPNTSLTPPFLSKPTNKEQQNFRKMKCNFFLWLKIIIFVNHTMCLIFLRFFQNLKAVKTLFYKFNKREKQDKKITFNLPLLNTERK